MTAELGADFQIAHCAPISLRPTRYSTLASSPVRRFLHRHHRGLPPPVGPFSQAIEDFEGDITQDGPVRLTQEQKPPLRLLLGSDAYNGAEKNDLARLEEARAWKELSLSTDF